MQVAPKGIIYFLTKYLVKKQRCFKKNTYICMTALLRDWKIQQEIYTESIGFQWRAATFGYLSFFLMNSRLQRKLVAQILLLGIFSTRSDAVLFFATFYLLTSHKQSC